MKDRVSKYPGRVKMIPVDGRANTFDMVRADAPEQDGTPLNKQTFLTDEVAAKFNLGENATPNDVFNALSGIVGADFVNENVWLVTQHTPAGKRIVVSTNYNTIELDRVDESSYENGAEPSASVYRTEILTVDPTGKLVPGEVTRVSVTGGSDVLSGYFWSVGSGFQFGSTYYLPEDDKPYLYFDEVEGEENSWLLLVSARPITVEDYEAQSGATKVVYGDPCAWPSSGYVETPDAEPYEGFIFTGLGAFKDIPLYIGSGGGDVTVVAQDAVLFVPQELTDEQKAQARQNIGAAAIGEGGSYELTEEDKAEIVEDVLAALPNAEEAEF